ncbi:hypothetical protein Ae168Ps1_3531c [Pseudonocardia sp. Ae168_Ps1]|uniref:uridine kinase n=1 Tax=unclassified Pseudonocardia TaxID=2619320 RepID=UPI0009619754|nr:hypothetical protein Ae168Ps1_3531c [Pseudonocardia sp. Ae168_Ps1]
MAGGFRPTDRDGLAAHLVERVTAVPGRLRVVVDGSPPTGPVELARAVAGLLRDRGRDALAVDADDFLRPASVRLEFGRTDPAMFLDGWLDEPALRREVLGPMAPDGSGSVLPRLRDVHRDRAFRDEPVPLGASGVVLLGGGRLLGRGLPADLTVTCGWDGPPWSAGCRRISPGPRPPTPGTRRRAIPARTRTCSRWPTIRSVPLYVTARRRTVTDMRAPHRNG